MTVHITNTDKGLLFGILMSVVIVVSTILGLHAYAYSGSYVASSTSYILERDSINVFGAFSSSTNYSLEDTGGEVGTGYATSSSYSIDAGYQQGSSYISMSAVADVFLTPAIGGVTGGSATGSTTVIVTTDSGAGYQLTIESENNPAFQSHASFFTDYTDASSPDFIFSIAATSSEFGFTPEGADITQFFKDNGTDTCNVGSNDTVDRCWTGLSASAFAISQGTASNHPTGATTTLKFRAESGVSHLQLNGTYTATTTLTAVTL